MRLITYITSLLFILTAPAVLAQSYALQFVEVANAKAVDGFYDVKIQITAASSAFDLGLANLTFTYNTNGFYSQHSPDDGTKAASLLTAHNFNSGGYSAMDLTEPQRGVISVNVNYNFETSGNGDNVALGTWTDVATVRFVIRSTSESTGLTWQNDQALGGLNPVVVYNDAAPATQITRSSISGLNNPLPVELIYFTSEKNDDKVLLKWGTQVEINNDYFEIQRSTNNLDWYALGQVAGFGTTIAEQHYSYTDYELPTDATNTSAYFYRLKQVDFDGSHSFSDVETVYLDNIRDQKLSIYPNPASSFTTVGNAVSGTVSLYNHMGRLVKTSQNNQVDVSELAPGMYTVQLTSHGQVQTSTLQVK